jgi:tetratricopeptide (TPR) repeat protein
MQQPPADVDAGTPWLIRLALVALVIAVYWPAMRFGYVQYDDPEYVSQNIRVQQGLSVPTVAWAFTTGDVANWHPITWLSLMLDSDIHRWLTPLLGGSFWTHAAVHHSMNILLHGMNVLLLFGVLRSMTGMVWRSAIVAGLLAAHPMHVESVAWISERKDVLSLLFWLLAMQAYVRYSRELSVPNYLLVLLFAALSLMSKPMAVTLPFALLLLDFWPLQRMEFPALNIRFWRCLGLLFAEKIPLLMMSVAMSIVTVRVQHREGILTEGRWMTLPERLEISIVGYARYLGKFFWPADLAALYPNLVPLGVDQWSSTQVAGAAGLVLALSIVALVLLRRAPYLAVGWLWFLGTLAPVIGLVQIGRHSLADRYTYIPYVGLYIAVVWLLGDALGRVRAQRVLAQGASVACAIAGLLALGYHAHQQVYKWEDNITLFSHAAAVTERNWMMLNNLAAVLEQGGRRNEGLQHLRAATEICHECAWVHEHYGEMLARAGRLYDAQMALERAVTLDPNDQLARTNLGMVLSQRGQMASAMPHLQRAVELKPDSADARKNLAVVLALNGQTEQAIEQLREAIRLNPGKGAEYQSLIEAIRAQGSTGAGR